MKKFLSSFGIVLSIVFVSSSAAADDIGCDTSLGEASQRFLDKLTHETVLFSFPTGDIHILKTELNQAGNYVGTYGDGFTTYYYNMDFYACRSDSGTEYILAHKDRSDPDGTTHRREVLVMIPQSDALFDNARLSSFVDLRWGAWQEVVVQLR
jgi:hypothetical protein